MALAKAREIVSSAAVVVFSKTNCRHSKWVMELLTQLGAGFRVVELDLESDGSDVQSALTEWTGQGKLPIIFIGGHHIGICESAKNCSTRILQALEDASIIRVGQNIGIVEKFQLFFPHDVDTVQLRNKLPSERNYSMSSEPVNDTEDQEASDDDDDRNHKHRRREAHSISFDDVQELPMQRMNRRRSKLLDNRQNFHGSGNNGNMESSSNYDKGRSSFTPPTLDASHFDPRGRINQTSQSDTFYNAPKVRLPVGRGRSRGRGRNIVSWNQQDSRFNPLDTTLDFPSQVVSQGLHAHVSLFGTGIPNAAGAQNSSWGAYGFVNEMSNRILDPLQPLGLQGALQPTITPLFNLGMPRQRCRDFDEQGYCLRGDMCPMEHGVHRIVVEDVQSLSQFNLSVSDQNSHVPGIQAGQRPLPSANAPSTPLTKSSKFVPAKDAKSLLPEDSPKLNMVSSSSGLVEADVYDPDQPLWNNGCQGTSETTLMLSLENNDELVWNVDSSFQSSVQDQIGHTSRSEIGTITINNAGTTNLLSNEMKVDKENSIVTASTTVPEKQFTTEKSQKPMTNHLNSASNSGRMSQKALRTLYVHGIPQKNNTRDALLSHFQKFGEVVDIYIPQNSEKAFVQFSKREEAEAALKAPDAVMGNRFIKLWWANRDRDLKGQKNFLHKVLPSFAGLAAHFPSRPVATENEKGDMSSSLPHENKLATSEIFVSIPVPKSSANILKINSPGKKNLDGLEALKEELRKKQENLALKREEFRRQLENFEKQAVSVKKGEVILEPAPKRLKPNLSNEGEQTEPSIVPNVTEVAQKQIHNAQEIGKLVSATVSCTAKSNSTVMGNSSTEQINHQHLPKLSNCSLDSRPTSFRVLPPLPAGLTNVADLRDHFAVFGNLSSVTLEEPEEGKENVGMKTPEMFCAHVTFSSCDSAVRAYTIGKFWQGHNLHFMWLNDPSNSKNCSTQEVLGPPESSIVAVEVNPGASATSQIQRNSADIALPELMAPLDEKSSSSVDNGHSHFEDGSETPLLSSHSNYSILSCEERQAMPGAQVVEDNMNIGFAQ